MDYFNLIQNYKSNTKNFYGERYLSFSDLKKALEALNPEFEIKIEGKSVLGNAIKSINFGRGRHNILIWSQMHGNETTTTKSLLDTLHILSSSDYSDSKERLLDHCRLKILPMLNPDGANAYTRANANQVDLNRDALAKTQKETEVLFKVLDQFKPDFCFNMHGQRTIFSAGSREYPATLSFLAPSFNEKRSLSATRITAMQLIVAASERLNQFIPHQVARYDDAFNENCFGDYLTKQGIPTVLFEAGHYQNDYYRDKTRQYVTISLLAMLNSIISNTYPSIEYENYFHLPENEKKYVDIVVTNIDGLKSKSLGILYKELCIKGKIVFKPILETIKDTDQKFAHRYVDAKGKSVLINGSQKYETGIPIIDLKIDGEPITDIFI